MSGPGPDSVWLRQAIGPGHADYYLTRFATIDARGPWTPTWNWAAFFFSTFWFYRRGMPGFAVLNALLFCAALFCITSNGIALQLAGLVAAMIVFLAVPMYANALYYRRLRKQFARVPPTDGTVVEPIGLGPVAATLAACFTIGVGFVAAAIYLMTLEMNVYLVRSRVTEVINAAGVCRTSVEEFYRAHKRMPSNAGEAQCPSVGTANSMAPRVNAGVISVQAGGDLRKRLEGEESGIEFRYTPVCDGGACTGQPIVAWDCKAGATIRPRFLPTMCR